MGATFTLATEATSLDGGIPWLTPVIAILTLLLGSSGVVAFYRARHDARRGVSQQAVATDDSVSNRWKAIIEAQTKTLLEPMSVRISTLESKIGALEADLATSRRKYWSAISHIRTLYTWISRHMPDDIEQTQVPAPPATLVDDI
jgi:hypothetical protein